MGLVLLGGVFAGSVFFSSLGRTLLIPLSDVQTDAWSNGIG